MHLTLGEQKGYRFGVILVLSGLFFAETDFTRGAGRSVREPSDQGNVGDTARIMADIGSIVSANLPSQLPLFLFGHSMGGLAVFTYACVGPSDELAQIRGFIGESPDFGLPLDAPTRPPWFAILALKVLYYINRKYRMSAPLTPSLLTRDEFAQKQYLEDPLSHHLFSTEGILWYFDRVKKLTTHKVKLSKEVKSIWIGHGTKDGCTEYNSTKRWMNEIDLADKEFRTYEGAWHNRRSEASSLEASYANHHLVHSDTDGVKEAFINDVVSWVKARST